MPHEQKEYYLICTRNAERSKKLRGLLRVLSESTVISVVLNKSLGVELLFSLRARFCARGNAGTPRSRCYLHVITLFTYLFNS